MKAVQTLVAAAAALLAGAAHADITIGVSLPMTGAASSLGARELADLASEVERQCALPDNEANLHRAASNLGARLKAQVLAVDRDLQRLDETLERAGPLRAQMRVAACDVTDASCHSRSSS